MNFFRKHHKTFVWLLIIIFLMYLLPTAYIGTQVN
jgi:hypothetical protein